LIALCFSWNTAKAQEPDDMTLKIQQNWAFPDCGKYTHALSFTRYFYLKSSKKEMTLLPYTLAAGGTDYRFIRQGGENLPARIENDGILKIGIPAEKSPQKAKNWDGFTFDQTPEYTACSATPKVIPKAMERILRYVDRIRDKCDISVKNDCARVIFKLADENNDKKLTPVEIKKGVLSALLFAELGQNGTIQDAEIKAIGARAKEEGEKIAADLIARYDADKSGSLDYNEVAEDFTAPQLPVIKEMLAKAGKLIPIFQMAAATMD
jgi:hypothetical protein